MKLQAECRETLRRRLASALGVSPEVKQRSTLDAAAARGHVVDLRGG